MLKRENCLRTRDFTALESEQGPSEDQTYRETMKGIRAYMGWSDIPDLDKTTTASDDNPFTGPKATIPRESFRTDAYGGLVMQEDCKTEPNFG